VRRLIVAALAGAATLGAQPFWRAGFEKHPVVRGGEWVEVAFRSRLQWDSADFGRFLSPDEPSWTLRRARIGLDGKVGKRFEFQVERDFHDRDRQWRDLWVSWKPLKNLDLRGGRHKIPFGREQLTPVSELDFIDRSRLADLLSPARDTGLSTDWKLKPLKSRLQGGAFLGGGDNGRTGRPAGALRWTARPLPGKRFGTLELGAAATLGRLDQGLNSLRGRTSAGETFFRRIYAGGLRRSLGAEAEWRLRGWKSVFEFARVADERRGQGFLGEDLAPLVGSGWSLALVRRITAPVKERISSIRWSGGLELAGRYEAIEFGGGAPDGKPSVSPRARTIQANSDRIWAFGINGRPQRNLRWQANLLRESIREPMLGGHALRQGVWVARLRLQLLI
jgi:hypothetical protein